MRLVELRLDDTSGYSVGQEIDAGILAAGDKIDVTAVSKGKGFAGGMKRHNFKGQGGAHGNHKHHRAPGSVGACATPARVFKGTQDGGPHGFRACDDAQPRGRRRPIPSARSSSLRVPSPARRAAWSSFATP